MFEANNIHIKSKSGKYPDGHIECHFFNSQIFVMGEQLSLFKQSLPKESSSVIKNSSSGSEGQVINLIMLFTQSVDTDRQAGIVEETSPFYVEEPYRKKPRVRINRVIL